ncbi:hypothetical protein [Jiella marina]|uniref:hypothetical protein n=1 Tax=Jiella sp. LLJ827 TaxID=2917712 RepID=UPI0021018B18|nr:hypothetical protein [Jiella sp. LLJ827]MCQ0989941.1 hypothetical protein [Jiella sp. LLJ827]
MNATYTHEEMTREAYAALLMSEIGDRDLVKTVRTADFYHLEYINSPVGLVVLAHHGMNGCEAIHPAAFDFEAATGLKPLDTEPVPGVASNFLRHSIRRRQTGSLVLAACGRMIHAGEPEAPGFRMDFGRLEATENAAGLVVAALKDRTAYVIRPSLDMDLEGGE